VFTTLRHYAPADSAADRGLALAPTNRRIAWQKVMIALAQGHLDSALAVIRASARQIDSGALFSYLANYTAGALIAAERVRRRPRGTWAIARTQLYHLRGWPRPYGRLRRLGTDRV
jgi:hypothetical protein